jgi:hypothetical protein
MDTRAVLRSILKEAEGDESAILGDFDPAQVIAGVAVELEHTSDFLMAAKIALDHLQEDPRYYSTVIPFEEVKGALQKTLKSVKEKREPVQAEAASGGAIGGLSGSGQLPGAGQPSRFVPHDQPSPLNRDKKKKRKRLGDSEVPPQFRSSLDSKKAKEERKRKKKS